MRVLYVDDDRVHLLLFEEACRFAPDVEIRTADSGAEALDLVRGWSPDLLVIDLHLPDTSGYMLLPKLREAIGAPPRPAFLCTAEESDDVFGVGREAGFDGFWSKPVDVKFVLRELESRCAPRGRVE